MKPREAQSMITFDLLAFQNDAVGGLRLEAVFITLGSKTSRSQTN